MPSVSNRFVQLRGGLTVPLEPLMLSLDLEARGFTLVSDGRDLVVSPASRLTREDRQALRRWKLHLMSLAAYEPPCGEAPGDLH